MCLFQQPEHTSGTQHMFTIDMVPFTNHPLMTHANAHMS